MMRLFKKIKHKWTKLRLRPIRVYCLHHVCKQYNSDFMYKEDWMDIDTFKQKVITMIYGGVKFISLVEAQKHLCQDILRHKNYAVLTFDDGYETLNEILPWLKEHNIPVTLFVNPDYADGKSVRKTTKEKYLSRQDLSNWNIEIGMHGFQHLDASAMEEKEFQIFVNKTVVNTYNIKGYIPFWAYTWGRHNEKTDCYLQRNKIIPVYIDGMKNYNDVTCIHRELLIC